MKFLILLHFWLFFQGTKSWKFEINSTKESNLAVAVENIIEDFFFSVTDVINLVTADHSLKAMYLKQELLPKIYGTAKVVVRQEEATFLQVVTSRRRRSAILIIENFEDFEKFYPKMSRKLFIINGRYLIVFVNGQIKEIQQIFDLVWKVQAYKVLVVFEASDGSIQFQTFFPFNNKNGVENCNDTSPVTIDTFKDGEFLNNKRKIFRDKMKNLNNCKVRVSLADNTEPYVFAKSLSNGSFDISGGQITFLKALSQSLNFKIEYVHVSGDGSFIENETSIEPLQVVQKGEADLAISNFWLFASRLEYLDASVPYTRDPVVFVVPPGRELTPFEKLVFPFSFNLWILIWICFLIGLLVIFFVKRHSLTVGNFVIGTGVKLPYLNMLIGFVGGQQKILPKRNFARFLLMMFLLYSLVIRTLYQGSFYNLMRSNPRLKGVQTIEEMITKDFTFYTYEGDFFAFKGTKAISQR